MKRLTKNFSEGRGREETLRDRLLQKMQNREFIYNRACEKARRPFKAVYFCLPKVKFKTAHTRKETKGPSTAISTPEALGISFALVKEGEGILVVSTNMGGKKNRESSQSSEEKSPVYAGEKKNKENSNFI